MHIHICVYIYTFIYLVLYLSVRLFFIDVFIYVVIYSLLVCSYLSKFISSLICLFYFIFRLFIYFNVFIYFVVSFYVFIFDLSFLKIFQKDLFLLIYFLLFMCLHSGNLWFMHVLLYAHLLHICASVSMVVKLDSPEDLCELSIYGFCVKCLECCAATAKTCYHQRSKPINALQFQGMARQWDSISRLVQTHRALTRM